MERTLLNSGCVVLVVITTSQAMDELYSSKEDKKKSMFALQVINHISNFRVQTHSMSDSQVNSPHVDCIAEADYWNPNVTVAASV